MFFPYRGVGAGTAMAIALFCSKLATGTNIIKPLTGDAPVLGLYISRSHVQQVTIIAVPPPYKHAL